ncbi:MAG: hypothetical protein H0U76_22455 [Ktedonobacteraceae bacterium]|nr:hypothetical protein [Ktedonobacteraceae bacterium]
MESMSRADLLSLLADNRFFLSIEGAQDFLGALESSLDLMQLYQEFFPTDYQQAQAQGLMLFPPDGQSYSECEVQFFECVDRCLFPLPLDYWLDGTNDPFGERRLAHAIPVDSIGFDLEHDLYEDLPLGWQLLLYLMDVLDEDFLREHGILEEDALFDIPIERNDVSRILLTRRCEAQGGPLASFHLALQMLSNDTDSYYLNVTADNPYMDACWTKADLEELSTHYLLALDIRAKANCFCDWLEEKPIPRFSAVVRLWNSCVRDTTPREERPRTVTVSSSAFVEGLDMGTLFGCYITLPDHERKD